jgi:hypothetical protein
MKIKQKILMLAVTLGVMAGMLGFFPSQTALAVEADDGSGQTTDPADDATDAAANTEPYTEECDSSKNKCCGKAKTSIISGAEWCGDGGDDTTTENSTIWRMLIQILNIMTAGIGIAAVGGIVYGALLYTTAGDKPDQTQKAIGIITNVVIGLASYGLMYVLLNFLIPGGIFK